MVSWKQCLSDNQAWDTLTWFAALIAMAAYLNKFGFISWFSDQVRLGGACWGVDVGGGGGGCLGRAAGCGLFDWRGFASLVHGLVCLGLLRAV